MVRLRKAPETVMKVLDEAPRAEPGGEETLRAMGAKTVTLDGETPPETPPEPEAVECDVWVDLDGNPCAWSPVGAGVIGIEIGGDEDPALEVYRALTDKDRVIQDQEQRIAQLEAMVAKLAAKMAD